MSRRPADPLRLAAIARRVHVSEQRLCRLFKRSLGESPLHCAAATALRPGGALPTS